MSVKMNTTDMPAVTPTGTDFIPIARSGTPNSITPTSLAAFVIDVIEAIAAGTTTSGADSVFMLQGGALKPLDIDVVKQYVIDAIWANSDSTPVAADKMVFKTVGGLEKTVTLTNLSTMIRDAIAASILDVSDLTEVTVPAAADMLPLTVGTTGKMVKLSTLYASILSSLAAHVAGLTAVTAVTDTDEYYVLVGGVEKKITGASLKAAMGTTVAPATTTQYKVPQWASAQKTLVDGLTVETTVRDSGSALDTALATEKAVRDAIIAYKTVIAGSDTGAVVLRFGATATEGYETRVVDKTVALGAIAGVAVFTVPSGALLRSVQANIVTLGVAGGNVATVGIGVDADPDLYGQTSTLLKNAKSNKIIAPAVLSGTAAIELFPCQADGTIGDTPFSDGTVRVRIVYDVLASLDNV